MKLITVDQIMKWQPCEGYPRERVEELVGAGKTALEILELNIPHKDRLWPVLREEVIDAKILRLFVADCAERALLREREQGREPDERSWAAVEAARKYARGEIIKAELRDAWDAADDAAWVAADDATWAAVWDARADDAAAWAAADAAAWDAAYAAWADAAADARDAADDAARYAASAAWYAAIWAADAAADAWDAADAAARYAAYAAAADAARDAAWYAAYAAAREEERKWQINHLKELIS